MQDSEGKKKRSDREFVSSRHMPPRSARITPERGNHQTHAPTTTQPENRITRVKMPYLSRAVFKS